MDTAQFWKTLISVLGKASSWILATFVFIWTLLKSPGFTYLHTTAWNMSLWAKISKPGFSS